VSSVEKTQSSNSDYFLDDWFVLASQHVDMVPEGEMIVSDKNFFRDVHAQGAMHDIADKIHSRIHRVDGIVNIFA
jgi:hypothetical protein